MNPDSAFPLKLCINLPHRTDRWQVARAEFAKHHLGVERQAGVPASRVRDPWGFQNERRYACSLAKRLAIRRAYLAGVEAVLIFEDDIVFHPEWRERLAQIELPEDWGLFYLGCRHFQRPEVVAPWLVRCRQATDNHAFAVRREYFQQVMRGLKGTRKGAPRTILYSDLQLAGWQDRIPAYSAYPNLVWQRPNHSDNSRAVVGWYNDRGEQMGHRDNVAGLQEEMHERWPDRVPGEYPEASQPTDPDQPTRERPSWSWLMGKQALRRLEEAFPYRRYINLARREDRRNEAEYQFAVQGLAVERLAAVDARHLKDARGYGRVPEYACSLSHRQVLREGWRSRAEAVLVFEDDLILHPHFRALAEALPLPEDWGIFYFGCQHFRSPEVAGPGVVRVTGAWGMHAYAVRRRFLPVVLKELRGVQPDTGGRAACDLALTRLVDRIPTYAAYPNLAWQGPGLSSIRGCERTPFTAEGHQHWQPELLTLVNAQMSAFCCREGGGNETATSGTVVAPS